MELNIVFHMDKTTHNKCKKKNKILKLLENESSELIFILRPLQLMCFPAKDNNMSRVEGVLLSLRNYLILTRMEESRISDVRMDSTSGRYSEHAALGRDVRFKICNLCK